MNNLFDRLILLLLILISMTVYEFPEMRQIRSTMQSLERLNANQLMPIECNMAIADNYEPLQCNSSIMPSGDLNDDSGTENENSLVSCFVQHGSSIENFIHHPIDLIYSTRLYQCVWFRL